MCRVHKIYDILTGSEKAQVSLSNFLRDVKPFAKEIGDKNIPVM